MLVIMVAIDSRRPRTVSLLGPVMMVALAKVKGSVGVRVRRQPGLGAPRAQRRPLRAGCTRIGCGATSGKGRGATADRGTRTETCPRHLPIQPACLMLLPSRAIEQDETGMTVHREDTSPTIIAQRVLEAVTGAKIVHLALDAGATRAQTDVQPT